MASSSLSFDTETHRLQPGLLAPPLVCGSVAWLDAGPVISGTLLDKQAALETFAKAIEDPALVLVGANIAYDIAVMVVELAKLDIDAVPAVFLALEQGRVFDIQIAQALDAIAGGYLGKDPRTKMPIVNPETKRRGRYSLSVCVQQTLGRSDAKANDGWRTRYAELDGIPIAQWPQEARDYPVDDAKNTHEVALAQTGHLPKVNPSHEFLDYDMGEGRVTRACKNCGATRTSAECVSRSPHRNLLDHAAQVHTAFCLWLGAMWGFNVDQESVDVIERHAIANRARGIVPFQKDGVVREDGSEDRSRLKRLVATAYGAEDACSHCRGSGKMPSPKDKGLRCPTCKGRCQPWKAKKVMQAPTVGTCEACSSTGRIPHPRPKMINCALPEKGKTCDGTGLYLGESIPRSKTGQVAFGGSILQESGDEFLMALGDYKRDAKILRVYVPYFRGALVDDDFDPDAEDDEEIDEIEDAGAGDEESE